MDFVEEIRKFVRTSPASFQMDTVDWALGYLSLDHCTYQCTYYLYDGLETTGGETYLELILLKCSCWIFFSYNSYLVQIRIVGELLSFGILTLCCYDQLC